MKSLLLIVLALALAAALFFTRPTSEDFKAYVTAHPEITRGETAKGDSVADRLAHQMKSFADTGSITAAIDPVNSYLSQCTFDNYWLATNVKKNGQTVYTGVLGHWFAKNGAVPATTSTT
ncbi:MAG: hypothetical protein JWM97_206 [Phycisphaerales bacterium]|nr:hypothetical protein [Phycisphaerales bacterium]